MSAAWLEFLNHVEMLAGFLAAVALFLVFARLQLLAPTPATRLGLVASGLDLLVWLVFGTLWLAGFVPVEPLPGWVARVWDTTYFVPTLWAASIFASTTSLLALGLTLHRGIRPPGPDAATVPGKPQGDEGMHDGRS